MDDMSSGATVVVENKEIKVNGTKWNLNWTDMSSNSAKVDHKSSSDNQVRTYLISDNRVGAPKGTLSFVQQSGGNTWTATGGG